LPHRARPSPGSRPTVGCKLILRLGAAALALGLCALLLAPAAQGFTVWYWALTVSSADVRVFNNFADAEANDNVTPDPNFPGYTGATLAIWKASVEWGSTLHGTGGGDPTQPGDLGSGGSNFDPTFQGAALGPGPVGDNVHSAVATLGGGLVAWTEVTPLGGWRTLYSDAFQWDDDPLGPAAGALDLQSVATHEYGHALGLGHSTVAGSVMSASVAGELHRDLSNDDQAGLQFFYGAAAPTKPRITGVLVDALGHVTLKGQGFAPVSNEVWFTQAAAGGTGAPVTVTGLVSSAGGTRIELLLPPAAGPGDVLVKLLGTSFATLSNAWPLDLPGGVSCGALTYGVGLGGSNVATLDAAASPAVGALLSLQLGGFPADGPVFTLLAGAKASLALFGGTVLVDPGALILVLTTVVAGGGGTQVLAVPPVPSLAGAHVYAQAGQPVASGFALSNGLELVVCP
jgi:hypothetical protein